MKRSILIFSLAAAACIANAQVIKILGRKPNVSAAPNIIMMMADDMGPGDVYYYPWNQPANSKGISIITPHLDTMA